jgi:hypothetical protein
MAMRRRLKPGSWSRREGAGERPRAKAVMAAMAGGGDGEVQGDSRGLGSLGSERLCKAEAGEAGARAGSARRDYAIRVRQSNEGANNSREGNEGKRETGLERWVGDGWIESGGQFALWRRRSTAAS